MNLKIINDEVFESLYPIKMQKLSNTHWTPIEIAKKAIAFLAADGRKSILDLGSGSGKFCIVAAAYSNAEIVGVEKRKNLVHLSKKLAENLQLENVSFIQSDLIDLDFKKFDSFYFFNSFEELINSKDKLDKTLELDEISYRHYLKILSQKLEGTTIGTRIVTYCGDCSEIPDSFELIKNTNKGKLKFWEKVE